MNDQYILAIDQGTSETKTVIFNSQGEAVSKSTELLRSYFPKTGFVEQNPLEIYRNIMSSIKNCLDEFTKTTSNKLSDIVYCGVSNQKEAFVLWDVLSRPLLNAIAKRGFLFKRT